MKHLVLCFSLITFVGCSSIDSSFEKLSDSEFRITVTGLSKEGKPTLESNLLAKASALCSPRSFSLKHSGLGEKISYSGVSAAKTSGSWHGNESQSIRAVATVVCSEV
jgi:predicted component of type VI protein secretion system